jgi:hypothetical protein
MPRKSKDPELLARRELRQKLSSVLQELDIDSVDGVKNLFKEMIGTVLENGLEGELEDGTGLFEIRLPQQNGRQQPERS